MKNHEIYKLFGVICFFLFGIGLRIYRLDAQSLWYDEIATAIESSGSIRNIIFDPIFNMKIPPLHNLITHFFISDTNQEFWVRLPSVVFGSMTIVFLYFLAKQWFGRNIAITAAFLMSISPFHIWYSQEARSYAMFLFFAILTIFYYNKILINPQNFFSRIGFILSLILSIYTHTIAVSLVIIVIIVSIGASFQNKRIIKKQWFINYAIVAIIVLPALYLLLRHPFLPGIPKKNINMLYFYILPYSLWAFGTGYSLGPNLADLHCQSSMSILLDNAPIILPSFFIIIMLLIMGAIGLLKRYSQHSLKVLFWLLFPIIFTVVAAILGIGNFNVRYAIFSFPAFVLLLAVGIHMLRGVSLRLIALSFMVVISFSCLYNYYYNNRYHREDNRGAGHYLSKKASPKDVILCSASYTLTALKYYCDRDDLQWIGISGDDLLSEIGQPRIDDLDQIWLFRSRNFHGDPDGKIQKYLNRVGQQELEFSSNGVNLIKYVLHH